MDTQTDRPKTAMQLYGEKVTHLAEAMIVSMITDPERVRMAAGSIALAFKALAQRQPDVIDCTPQSVAQCVAMSALTGLYPSPVNPGCYVIPRNRSVKDKNGNWSKVRELNWQVSAIGLRKLARAAGYDVRPVVVWKQDTLEHPGGALDELSPEVPRLTRGAFEPIPAGADILDHVRGVVVVAFDAHTQARVGWAWVGSTEIRERRAVSDAWKRGASKSASDRDRESPWFTWPTGMIEKTSVRYALTGARAVVPVDDSVFTAAIELDDRGDRVVVDVPTADGGAPRQITQSARLDAALGLEPDEAERERILAEESAGGGK